MSDTTSSSSSIAETTNNDLKAGHPAAVKVGGMRVSAPRRTSRGEDTNTNLASAENDNTTEDKNQSNQSNTSGKTEETTGQISQNQAAGQLVGGESIKIHDAFPTEAVRHTYEKQYDNVPKHEAHTRTNHHEAKFIIQPRKM